MHRITHTDYYKHSQMITPPTSHGHHVDPKNYVHNVEGVDESNDNTAAVGATVTVDHDADDDDDDGDDDVG